MMLKLKQLRQEAYAAWELLCSSKGVYLGVLETVDLPPHQAERLPLTSKTFKDDIRQQFGDLRRRDTWERAAIQLTAHQMVQSYMEPYEIVGYMASASYMHCPIRAHYGELLIDAMLAFPEVLDIIRRGLEQLYQEPHQSEGLEIAHTFLKQFSSVLQLR